MLAADRTVMRNMNAIAHLTGLRGHHRGMVVMLMLKHRRSLADHMRGLACHGDGRERLNRKAQYEQHDNEEFAPVRHGYGV